MRRMLLTVAAAAVVGVVAVPSIAQGSGSAEPAKYDVFLYVDTVNGTAPAGTKPRPVGCTQTNYFARGERPVFRTWGSVAETGDILSPENVKYAYVKIPGQPNIKLNWGGHGAAPNRVWFWTAAWVIPKNYPLGTAETEIVFKTESNKFGRYKYDLTIVPTLAPRR